MNNDTFLLLEDAYKLAWPCIERLPRMQYKKYQNLKLESNPTHVLIHAMYGGTYRIHKHTAAETGSMIFVEPLSEDLRNTLIALPTWKETEIHRSMNPTTKNGYALHNATIPSAWIPQGGSPIEDIQEYRWMIDASGITKRAAKFGHLIEDGSIAQITGPNTGTHHDWIHSWTIRNQIQQHYPRKIKNVLFARRTHHVIEVLNERGKIFGVGSIKE